MRFLSFYTFEFLDVFMKFNAAMANGFLLINKTVLLIE